MLFKFADDTKVLGKVSSEEDINSLKHDLKTLSEWSDTWQMPFNVDKCKVLHAGYSNPNAEYYLKDERLSSSEGERDLGVHITPDFKSATQCLQAAKKANSALGAIKRTMSCRKKAIILPLYKSLVRPHLDYCISAWRPHYVKDLEILEKVQRRATKIISDCAGLDYERRLQICQLTTLETRFLRADLIEVFKLMKGLVNINPERFFELNPRISRGHQYKLSKDHARLDIRKYNFSDRIINRWNSLPSKVVEAESLNTFKGRLDIYLKN